MQKLRSYGVSDEDVYKFTRASWAVLLNRGPDAISPSDYTIVIVDDNGAVEPYWRVKALADHFGEGYAGYKAGREAKTDEFNMVAQIGLEYIAQYNLPYFTLPGYEADDWAGFMAYLRVSDLEFGRDTPLANREVLLYTIDRDWEQLVGRGVYWVNTGPWQPRVRGEEEVVKEIVKRAKRKTLRKMGVISFASQIVEQKAIEGDASDNLPAGSPRWAIDLIIQHPTFGLAYQDDPRVKAFAKLINSSTVTNNHEHVSKAFNWIASKGFPLLFPFDPIKDLSWSR